jgi:hypothetical protein
MIAWCQVWHGGELQPAVLPTSGERLKLHSVLPPSLLSQRGPQVKDNIRQITHHNIVTGMRARQYRLKRRESRI